MDSDTRDLAIPEPGAAPQKAREVETLDLTEAIGDDARPLHDTAETLDLTQVRDGAESPAERAMSFGDAESVAPFSAGAVAASEPLPHPRIRWAGIVWGLVFAALAYGGILAATGPDPVGRLSDWVQQVQPVPLIAYALLTVGGLILVTGLVGLARRGQKRLAARTGTGTGIH